METISIQAIKEIIKKNPNDADLGKEIRKFFSDIKVEETKDQTKK